MLPAMHSGWIEDFHAMGSPCRVRIDGATRADRRAREAVLAAVAEVRRIEAAYSRYRADSVVARINAAAGSGVPVAVDDETRHLLRFAVQLHEASDGRFDITSGVLRRAWDFRAAAPPPADAVTALLPLIGWQRVTFDEQGVSLPTAGMEIDFGGIGKEYAADRAATLLQQAGLLHGYVNLGGDIRLLGPMSDGQPWRLGIAHPRRPDELVAELQLADGALATSGDYERFIEHDGQRYSHILDPRTGWPVQAWQSVSVLAPACVAAGALATIAMLMGPQAPAFLRAQGVAHVLVDRAGRLQRWMRSEGAGAGDT
jgi:thiamine biosynthesis lipoprotein